MAHKKKGTGVLLQHLRRGALRQLFPVELLVEGIFQGRLVIPEKDDQGGLLHLAVIADQFLQRVVAGLGQCDILLGTAVRRAQLGGQPDGLGQVVPSWAYPLWFCMVTLKTKAGEVVPVTSKMVL